MYFTWGTLTLGYVYRAKLQSGFNYKYKSQEELVELCNDLFNYCPLTIHCLKFPDCYVLRESISAGDLVAVVGPGQVGDEGGPSLCVPSNTVPGVVVASLGDWLWSVELSLKSVAVGFHGIKELISKL